MCRWVLIVLWASLAGACPTQQMSAEEVFANQERAERLYQQGSYQLALSEYREVIESLPEHAQSWLRLGNCFAQLGRYPEAVAAYQRALVINPEFANAWINLSYVQAQILSQTVAEMYEQVPKTDPQAERVSELVDTVLAPFSPSQNAQTNSSQSAVSGRAKELNDYEEQ